MRQALKLVPLLVGMDDATMERMVPLMHLIEARHSPSRIEAMLILQDSQNAAPRFIYRWKRRRVAIYS